MDKKPMHIALGNERAEVWHNRPAKKEPVAIFFGPDREANAKLFLRAQHMGELVEAAEEASKTFSVLLSNPKNTLGNPQIQDVMARRKLRIDAILAKIGGVHG